MPGKQLLFKSADREKLLRRTNVLTDAVRVTPEPVSTLRPGKYLGLLETGIIDPTKVVAWLSKTRSRSPASCC